MINLTLKKDVKEGVFENSLLKVSKGTVGGFSIEVEEDELNAFSSYIYKKVTDRDLDYSVLMNEITLK
jgi:hypothetical protein